ncbi:hypothetical protein MKY34_04560 [Sporosarcina sp. FSL K6-1522]|uniref:hypothetical protein n=1 Tax=Sporosarcina sp. FSL K6-1522 TaxID=2921554 RepID=UPI003159F878
MHFLSKIFDWMVIIGLVLLAGRIITMVFMILKLPFITFFRDYSIPSLIILIVGAIGQQMVKGKEQ